MSNMNKKTDCPQRQSVFLLYDNVFYFFAGLYRLLSISTTSSVIL